MSHSVMSIANYRAPTYAITFNSIAIGVGRQFTWMVVLVGLGLPDPAKYSA
jgi:hypothetical protein